MPLNPYDPSTLGVFYSFDRAVGVPSHDIEMISDLLDALMVIALALYGLTVDDFSQSRAFGDLIGLEGASFMLVMAKDVRKMLTQGSSADDV